MNEIRFNAPAEPRRGEGEKKKGGISFGWVKKMVKPAAFVLILAALAAAVFLGRGVLVKVFGSQDKPYSAVFLTNGQVYFGKMIEKSKNEIVLDEVYYIQLSSGAAQEGIAQGSAQNHLNLVKLGNELHGPTNELYINASQVVFYEYLREDSKVVEAIRTQR